MASNLVGAASTVTGSNVGYRHVPLARRLGPSLGANGHWRVDMPDAECFLYFIAGMQRLFGSGHVLVVEGPSLATEVRALYEAHSADGALSPEGRRPGGGSYRVAMGGGLTRALNRLAARKTYAEIGERMLVYAPDGVLLLDGSRLGEHLVRLSDRLSQAKVHRFASGPLRGRVQWVGS